MTTVTNTGVQPLVLLGGTFLAPGVETEVSDWSKVKAHPITKFYLDSGVLVTGAVEDADEDPDDDRKSDLIARIKELGGKADKRSSVEKLEALLVEAQQAASAAESGAAAE
jgi:hypothetical protein